MTYQKARTLVAISLIIATSDLSTGKPNVLFIAVDDMND